MWSQIPETTRLDKIMELRLGSSGDDLWTLMQMEKLERVHRIASTLDEDGQAIVQSMRRDAAFQLAASRIDDDITAEEKRRSLILINKAISVLSEELQ